MTGAQSADNMNDGMLSHGDISDNGETSSSAGMATKPQAEVIRYAVRLCTRQYDLLTRCSHGEGISKVSGIRSASHQRSMAELDYDMARMRHESVDLGSIFRRFTDNGLPVPEEIKRSVSEEATDLALASIQNMEEALDTMRKELDEMEEETIGIPLTPGIRPATPSSVTQHSGTKHLADTFEKMPHAVEPPKQSRSDSESFVGSFDKLFPSQWQSMLSKAGEQNKQQVPTDPSTMVTLRTVYEVIDGLVAKGKLKRGKDLEMDENGWPKLCDDGPAPSRSQSRPAFESLSNRQKLSLLSLSSSDAGEIVSERQNLPARGQETNIQSARSPQSFDSWRGLPRGSPDLQAADGYSTLRRRYQPWK